MKPKTGFPDFVCPLCGLDIPETNRTPRGGRQSSGNSKLIIIAGCSLGETKCSWGPAGLHGKGDRAVSFLMELSGQSKAHFCSCDPGRPSMQGIGIQGLTWIFLTWKPEFSWALQISPRGKVMKLMRGQLAPHLCYVPSRHGRQRIG